MVLLLRAIARLVAFLVLLALAALGLIVALVTLLPALGDAFELTALRETAGEYLGQLEAGGPVALVSLLAGLLAVLAGLLLLVGALAPAREPLVVADEGRDGRLAARRRPLGQMAEALVAGVRGVTATKARVRPARKGRGGRLNVSASHTRSESGADIQRETVAALAPLADGFGLRTRVRPRAADSGSRVE